jgi:hypothetical protein
MASIVFSECCVDECDLIASVVGLLEVGERLTWDKLVVVMCNYITHPPSATVATSPVATLTYQYNTGKGSPLI